MSNKTARIIAIVALVFMVLFVAALVATLVDHNIWSGSIGFIALGLGLIAISLFIWLKVAGKTFDLRQMKDDSDLKAIKDKIDEQNAAEEAKEQTKENSDATQSSDTNSDGNDKSEPAKSDETNK